MGWILILKRRSILFAAAALWGGMPGLRVTCAQQVGQVRGKLMWDPVYLELPPDRKAPWDRWLQAGAQWREEEIRILASEQDRAGRRPPSPPKSGTSFSLPGRSPDWYRSAEALRMAESLVTWQTPAGGWSKNMNMTQRPRAAGQRFSPWGDWGYVATIDNQATTSQLEFLARRVSATGSARFIPAVERGLQYLLTAQTPTGGWPQVFPLQGTYHDQITFNDDAMIRVMTLFRNAKNRKEPWQFLDRALRQKLEVAVANGIQCILDCQIRVEGTLTAWCAQHHPVSLHPVGARAYELPSISGGETVEILRFLMNQGNPGPEVKRSIEAGVKWLRSVEVDAQALGRKGQSRSPQWARFYEIETNRPLFSDMDGRKRYSFSEVKEKRKTYAWFSDAPALLLERDYPAWKRRYGGGGQG